MYAAVKSLEKLPWEFLDDSSLTLKEVAQKIFAHPIISNFLIHLSRLDVVSKELASSFRSDLDSLLLIRKLKYFYNQPTVAVLQQLASLVPRYVTQIPKLPLAVLLAEKTVFCQNLKYALKYALNHLFYQVPTWVDSFIDLPMSIHFSSPKLMCMNFKFLLYSSHI